MTRGCFVLILAFVAVLFLYALAFADEDSVKENKVQTKIQVEGDNTEDEEEAVKESAPAQDVEGITVTATRMEKELQDVPVSVSVVTGKDLEQAPAATVADMLKDVPGVEVTTGTTPGIRTVRIRGESAGRVLVLIDGQRITEQKSMTGAPILINPSRIERIEVIKGPASVLYGSEAIGGVVNIITKKGGEQAIQLEAGVSVGSAADSFTQHLAVAGSCNGFEYRISEATEDFDNRHGAKKTIENTAYESYQFAGYLAYNFDTGKVGVSYDHYDSELSMPESDFGFYVADNYMPEWSRNQAKFFLELTPFEDSESSVLLSRVRFDAGYQNTLKHYSQNYAMAIKMMGLDYTLTSASDTKNDMDDSMFSVQTDWLLGDSHYLIFGGEVILGQLTSKKHTVKTRVGSNIGMSPAYEKTKGSSEFSQDTYALYLQDEWSVTESFILTPGLRYTYVTDSMDKSNEGFPKDDSNDDSLVFSLGATYIATENLTLRALFSQGYRMPNLQEKYVLNATHSAFSIFNNPDLDPETSNNFEIGMRYDGGAWAVDGTIFYSQSKDYITTELQPGGTDYKYVNADKATTYGAELATSYLFSTGIKPYVSLTYTKRKNEYSDYSTYDVGSPEFFGRAGVRFEYESEKNMLFFIDGYTRFSEKAREYTPTERTTYEEWATVNLNLGLSRELENNRRWYATVALENLLNKDYTEARQNTAAAGRGVTLSAGFVF